MNCAIYNFQSAACILLKWEGRRLTFAESREGLYYESQQPKPTEEKCNHVQKQRRFCARQLVTNGGKSGGDSRASASGRFSFRTDFANTPSSWRHGAFHQILNGTKGVAIDRCGIVLAQPN